MDTLLGQHTAYPTTYSPDVLTPIARSTLRTQLLPCAGIAQGVDWWHVFELSWINTHGLPEVRLAQLEIDAGSPCIVESKSLKLYFNSLNQHVFNNESHVIETIVRDLSACTESPVHCQLFTIDALIPTTLTGLCLDDIKTPHIDYPAQPSAALLKHTYPAKPIEARLYSHLFRSNCPVTHQPDWASIMIEYQGIAIDHLQLLRYLLSFRSHAAFHEHCVEHIYADIWQTLQPQALMVYAMFTRRGGIDINPCRVSHHHLLPKQPFRLSRQ